MLTGYGLGPDVCSTDLDSVLRNLGVTAIVQSVFSAERGDPQLHHGRGQQVHDVVLRATPSLGIPTDYGRAILKNTLSLLSTVVTPTNSSDLS